MGLPAFALLLGVCKDHRATQQNSFSRWALSPCRLFNSRMSLYYVVESSDSWGGTSWVPMCSQTVDPLPLHRHCRISGDWALLHIGCLRKDQPWPACASLSLHANCHLGAPSLWCTWVALHRVCCTQQGDHPPWKSECKLSARQALCSSCLTEVLSSHFLRVIIDPPELYHLYPYRGDCGAGNACSKLPGSGYLVLPLCLCKVLLKVFFKSGRWLWDFYPGIIMVFSI